jgi:hypothetical protein
MSPWPGLILATVRDAIHGPGLALCSLSRPEEHPDTGNRSVTFNVAITARIAWLTITPHAVDVTFAFGTVNITQPHLVA